MNEQLVDLARPEAEAAIAGPPDERRETLLALAATLYAMAWEDHGGEGDPDDADFLKAIRDAVAHTGDSSDPELVATVLATAADNAAMLATAPSGAQVTWHTMRDDRVRETHVPMEGVTQAAGTPFNVGGHPLMYPGQPVGPPDVWMNCRCSLSVATAAAAVGPPVAIAAAREEVVPVTMTSALPPEFLKNTKGKADECPDGQHLDKETGECVDDEITARAYDTDKRKAMAKSNTAMPDGSFPIADVEDLRNAIQAIGRARDPDAAKAHIRKRARALGHADLIPESWSASAASVNEPAISFASSTWNASFVAAPVVSPPGTHDAPGWITNPRETQRLRTYWSKGTGAAKIRWGQPGDFDRCRKQLAKYVTNPEWLAGTCANLHFVALGFWPGQGPHASAEITAAVEKAFEQEDETMGLPPREWFEDPKLTGPTPLHLEGDGRLVGHLAAWGTCHVGIENACTEAPHSNHGYAYFRTGEVETSDGMVAVGQITMDTGHAARHLGPNETVAHYDNTGTVVADVSAGEDAHGIWLAGAMRPGLTLDQMRALRAGAPSGDWRRIAGNLELVAALMVNVPGFPVPRIEMAASGELVTALTAAAVVVADPNALIAADVAELVVRKMEDREAARLRAARVRSLNREVNRTRVAELVASVEG